ncbi:MAG: EcsC family protein [Elusimicrobia bacterium]|nr:EcsC family protein [Elusimicrobiota bacterium]
MKRKPAAPLPFQRASAKMLPKLQKLLAEVVNDIPVSDKKKEADPKAAARGLTTEAARHTALLSGALALPSGPLGVLTMIPDLVAVWRRQARLVSDIAAVYGQESRLTREMMMYCLFRHVSSDAVKDIVVRTGQRVIVSQTTVVVFHRVLRVIVGDLLSMVAGRFMARWLPVIGSAAVAAYSYRDTKEVGQTAIEALGSPGLPEGRGQSVSRKGRKKVLAVDAVPVD